MNKEKIAISIDTDVIKLVDAKVDGTMLRSRSQAIEYFTRKGLGSETITAAVILLRGSHQNVALKNYEGKKLIEKQIEFFKSNGIENIYLITQKPNKELRELLIKSPVKIIDKEAKANGSALKVLQKEIKDSFLVMSGDTYNEFDLQKMINKHKAMGKLATMGLMTREETKNYGTAIIDGDLIIDFREHSKEGSSHIVNAGIYIFKPEVFELITSSLEYDLFPKLAKIKELVGFFTYGEYAHLG